MSAALHTLQTPRLQLLPPDAAQTAAVVDFYRRNAAHFAPWDPPLPPDHSTPDFVHQALADAADAFAAGRAMRWWLAPADALTSDTLHIIGSVHLSGVTRGAFQSCNLGYALDAACQGQGLMHEALAAVIHEAFAPRLNLHRIQAAVRPENQRSLAVMARLQFRPVGLATDYLFIDGGWHDHQLFERINPGFMRPAGW